MTVSDIKNTLQAAGPTFNGGTPESLSRLAGEWADEFSGDAAAVSDWIAEGFWCPVTARQVADLGIEPGEFAGRCNDQITGYDAADDIAYAMCNNDLSVSVLVD